MWIVIKQRIKAMKRIKDKNTTLARIKKYNRSITSLTPAQHNALEYLATVRHKMHVNQEAFIKADAGLQ